MGRFGNYLRAVERGGADGAFVSSLAAVRPAWEARSTRSQVCGAGWKSKPRPSRGARRKEARAPAAGLTGSKQAAWRRTLAAPRPLEPAGARARGIGVFRTAQTRPATGRPLRFLAREIQGGVKLTFESTRRVIEKLLM
jgi:hypothetical protein